MTYLILKRCDEVTEQLPVFQSILQKYGIEISDSWENPINSTIELILDTIGYVNGKAVEAVAYDCFDINILSIKHSQLMNKAA